MAVEGGRPSPAAAATTAVLALAAAAGGVLAYGWLAPPDVPIVELELAGSLDRALELGAGGRRDDFLAALRADWLLILGYGLGLVLALRLGRRILWTPRSRSVAAAALAATGLAVLADLIGNALLRHGLTTASGDPLWEWAQAAAFTKFGLLALAVPVAGTAVAFTLGRLAIRRLRRPERFGEREVLPAPPLEPTAGEPLATEFPPTSAARAPVTRWEHAATLPPGRPPARVGICASGGGIRSACVTLGALQALRAEGELQRARYLVSVSGGGYTAGAFQLALRPRPGVDDPAAATPEDVLAPGSAEEDHIRRHGRYVADSAAEWLAALSGLARGLLVSLGLLTLTVAAAGLTLSAFYRLVPVTALDPLRPTYAPDVPGPAFPDPIPGVLLTLAVVGGLALGLHLLALVAPLVVPRSDFRSRWLGRCERSARGLAGLGAVLALLGAGVPALVWLAAQAAQLLADLGGRPVSAPVGGGVLTVLLAYVGTLVGVLWRGRTTVGAQVGRLRGLFTGRGGAASAVPTGLVQRLVVRLALFVLVAALLLVLGAVVGLARSWPWWVPVAIWALLAGVVLALDQTWLSLHPFYRQRLAGAFSVRRATGADGRVVAAPYDFDNEQTNLHGYAGRVPGFPQVIFAAAANLSGSERTPPGRKAVSFTLADDWIGGPDVGWLRTEALQDKVGGQLRRDLTVQAAVAISGAAFASAIGRQARSYQTFFALSGARLGAWLPNPAFVHRVRTGEDWQAPRLPRLRRLPYLFREILGSYPHDDRLLYCTDGGHYENLGLVELLRHRCRLVYCIDASGDSPPLATTLAEAITLAYEELGVTITLADPRMLVPGFPPGLEPADPLLTLNARLSASGVVAGRITYPTPVDWPGAPPGTEGVLIVAKATLPADVPYELLSYAASNPVFPRDSTSDQWFDHGQFDAYHALGRHLGGCAAEAGGVAEQALDQEAAGART